MAVTPRLVAGTGGFSVWQSDDFGKTWNRPYAEHGIYPECRVWGVVSDRREEKRLYAATDMGIYMWIDADRKWRHLPSQLDNMPVWCLVQSPHDADVFIAGTQFPAALFMSRDSCKSWEKLDITFAETCVFVGSPRVTHVLFDPEDPQTIWTGVEIDGAYRSRDGGKTWTRVVEGLVSEDLHYLVSVQADRRKLFATTNRGLHKSYDGGDTWEHIKLDTPWPFLRELAPAADDSGTMFLCNGNGPPGHVGKLLISHDWGDTWSDAPLPVTPNSTLWSVATNPADPNIVFVCSNLGEIYHSLDKGKSWTKQERELGELRKIVWLPA
jgi:photosystem II stability/assembly factor-like uncharacterized protein